MFELIPSETMRQIFKEDGFEFSDFQKATLIWNAPNTTRQERLEALMHLADTTEDAVTKTQIHERLDFEKKVYEAFLDNSEQEHVYVVRDDEHYSCGFFADYERAVKYAMKYAEKHETQCGIEKYRIVKDEKDMVVRSPWKGNPNMGLETEEYSEYDGDPAATVAFNENGEIVRLWSNELSKEEEDIVDQYRRERFELQFIKMPFELEVGLPVRNVVNNTYGVLAKGKEDWERYLNRIEERNLYVDYVDAQVMVYELTETGYWSHEHVSPLYLEIDFPDHIENDEKRNKFRAATEALSDYLTYKSRGKDYPSELVIKTAKAYAEVCHEKSRWEKVAEEAEKLEDLLC